MENLQNKYLEYLKNFARLSQNTQDAYIRDVNELILYFNFNASNSISLSLHDIREYIAHLKSANLAPASMRRKISAIKAFGKYLIHNGIVAEEKLQGLICVPMPKLPARLPKAISNEEVYKIIQYIMTENTVYKKEWHRLRDLALILLLYGCGLRISEGLSLQRIAINSQEVKICGKGGKERYVYLMDSVLYAINQYLAKLPFNRSYLFVSNSGREYSARIFQKNLELIRTNLGMSGYVTPHCLRHSCATDILNNGGEIRIIQKLLGHASLSTTQIYTKVSHNKMMQEYEKVMS